MKGKQDAEGFAWDSAEEVGSIPSAIVEER